MNYFRGLITLGIVMLVLPFQAASADPTLTKTMPSGADDIIDYRVSGCTGTEGFGRLTYQNSGRTVLTDMCLNEDTGEFLSAEPLGVLELTSKSRNGRKFEDLSSGGSFYERNHVQIIPDENIPGCTSEPIESVHAAIQSPRNPDIVGQNFGHFIGYTFPFTAAFPGRSQASIYFGLRSVVSDPSHPITFRPGGLVNAQGDMHATAVFDRTSGIIEINEGAGYTYGDAQGTFEMEFLGDGTFTMSGEFTAASLRLKGHEPTEMVSIDGELAHFRGHVIGSNGSGLLGYGIAEGKVTDASGNVHAYQSMAYLLACLEVD